MAYGLKYYFEFLDTDSQLYRTEIHQLDYTGEDTELETPDSPVTLDIPEVDNKLTALRGSSLRIRLLATETFDLSDLYSEREKKFLIIHKLGEIILFRGYIIPDGAIQSFVAETWEITIDAIDGIGLLKDLAFVDELGLFFSGKMSVKDVIFYCLRRIGIPDMNLFTAVNTYYDTANTGLNSLDQVFVNTERYIKEADGDITPMNCQEVLSSTLEIFAAQLTQYRGHWYVYKVSELFEDSTLVPFYQYDGLTGDPLSGVTRTFDVNIGSQINEALPFHANENQEIALQKAYKIFRVNYKFGLLTSLTTNQQFRDFTDDVPDGWELVVIDPAFVNQHPKGLIITGIANVNQYVKNQNVISLLAGAVVTIEITNGANETKSKAYFIIKAGVNYLQNDLTWDTTVTVINTPFAMPGGTSFMSITTPPLPADADLEVRLLAGMTEDGFAYSLYERVTVIPVKSSSLPGLGEFHTVEQVYDYSYIPDNKVVYNGDNFDESDVYVGSLYKADDSFTSVWDRANSEETSRPLLRLMAEEFMRMHQRQYLKFSGGFFGYFDYLSLIQISSIAGKFMPVGLQFDYSYNTGSMVLLEIINTDLPGYDPTPEDEISLLLPGTIYTVTDDYGTPIKPLIR